MFDLNVYPYPVSERLFAPGFLVFPPKDKAARGRDDNLLIIYFSLMGHTSITAEGLRTWMEQKAEAFHRSAGTVTAGIRELVESINADLYDRNVRPDRKDSQVLMNLQVAVVKKEMVYLANCGSGQIFFVGNDNTLIFKDGENAGRGLGQSQSTSIRFSQSVISSSDLLMMSFNAPTTWTTDLLSGGQAIPLEAFARRLLSTNTPAGRGVIIRFVEGTGKVSCLRIGQPAVSEKAVEKTETDTSQESKPIITPPAERSGSEWVPAVSTPDSSIHTPQPEGKEAASQQAAEGGIQLRRITRPSARGNPRASQPTEQTYEQQPEQTRGKSLTPQTSRMLDQWEVHPAENQGIGETYSRPTRPVPQPEPQEQTAEEDSAIPLISTETIKAAVGKTLRKGAEVKDQTGEFVKDIAQKVMPGEPEKPLHFSKGLLVFIAVAVPVIILAIALSVYIRNGRNSEVSQYLAEAQQYVALSNTQLNDSAAQISSLQSAVAALDKADSYGKTSDSVAMRNSIQSMLDNLQGIIRVDMTSALSDITLPGVNITQMVATASDLYTLDGISGKVLRFTLSGSSYVQDTSFDCGPNPENPLNAIGKLVDMVAIPASNSYGATIMAIDGSGTLEYCVPNDTGYVVNLSAPDMGWGTIQSMTLYESNLYILDTKGNAVYRYEGSGTDFKDKPTLFFDETIPQLTSALDIEEQGYELYILRSGGDMVECTYSPLKDMKSTECEEPAPYLDARTSQDIETNTFPNTQFSQLHLTEAPDSSIYILDSANDQVYHFSYIRSLQRVLTPRMSDGTDSSKLYPTAFTVSSTRLMFIAYSNQIYYGQIP